MIIAQKILGIPSVETDKLNPWWPCLWEKYSLRARSLGNLTLYTVVIQPSLFLFFCPMAEHLLMIVVRQKLGFYLWILVLGTAERSGKPMRTPDGTATHFKERSTLEDWIDGTRY